MAECPGCLPSRPLGGAVSFSTPLAILADCYLGKSRLLHVFRNADASALSGELVTCVSLSQGTERASSPSYEAWWDGGHTGPGKGRTLYS